MEESKDPFTTESVKVKVADQELVIAPLPFKKFREAVSIVRKAFSLAQSAAETNPMAVVEDVPDILMVEFSKLAPVLFNRTDLPAAWYDENMSVPVARACLEAAARVNGVGDFLAYLRKATSGPQPEAAQK
jgi:hypothetical protein